MAQNSAPETDSFCAASTLPDEVPKIRFVGGVTIQSTVDPTHGVPGDCGLSLNMVGTIQAALAPFQPFLTLVDMVATIANFVLVLTEVVGNPFKIGKLLRLFPQFNEKLQKLLSIIPVFPQGIIQFAGMIADIAKFAAMQVGCVIDMLVSIQAQIDELNRLATAANECDDAALKQSLEASITCGREEVARQTTIALGALAPIARLLCTIRAILSIIPGGAALQSTLAFPNPATITDLTAAISTFRDVRESLLAAARAIGALSGDLSFLLPNTGFSFDCPLDDSPPSTEPVVDPPEPQIAIVFDPLLPAFPIPPITSIAISASPSTDPVLSFRIRGANFDAAKSSVYWGTEQLSLAEEQFEVLNNETIDVHLPNELRANAGNFQMTVVNGPPGASSTPPFSGIPGPDGVSVPTGASVSNLWQMTVS